MITFLMLKINHDLWADQKRQALLPYYHVGAICGNQEDAAAPIPRRF
jgi:hypothetical protein